MRRQAKKVRGVQTAFRLFNRIMRVPGKGELTMVELRVRGDALSAPPCCTLDLLAICIAPALILDSRPHRDFGVRRCARSCLRAFVKGRISMEARFVTCDSSLWDPEGVLETFAICVTS